MTRGTILALPDAYSNLVIAGAGAVNLEPYTENERYPQVPGFPETVTLGTTWRCRARVTISALLAAELSTSSRIPGTSATSRFLEFPDTVTRSTILALPDARYDLGVAGGEWSNASRIPRKSATRRPMMLGSVAHNMA